MVWAACAGQTAIMFPDDGLGSVVARQVCVECIVQVKCLEYAIKTGQEHGIWGGKSERWRRSERRRRAAVARRA